MNDRRNIRASIPDARRRTIFFALLLAVILAVAVAVALISVASGETKAPEDSTDPVIITELMPNNKTTLKDNAGAYSDWIELRNTNSSSVVLSGYYLSDDPTDPFMWPFPDITLSGGEYLTVFCTGADYFDSQSGSYHTSFRLGSSGETVLLTNSKTGETYSVTYTEALPDVSFGLIKPEGSDSYSYKWLDTPTPGKANAGNWADSAYTLPSLQVSGLVINEYMTANTCTLYDSDGEYCDWVELYNGSDEAVDLNGCFLTDEEFDTGKWMFPEGCTIGSGEYLTVFLSGKDRFDNGELHTSFKVGRNDSVIAVYDRSERLIDRADIVPLPDDVSRGRDASGEWVYFSYATPGRENSGVGYVELPESTSLDGQLYISEVFASESRSQTTRGSADWIEIYNSSSEPIALGGYSLGKSTDDLRAFVFPETTLDPGAVCVVDAAGDKASGGMQAAFHIDSSGDTLYLSDPSGRVIDVFRSGKIRTGITSGRAPDGCSDRVFFATASKGSPNPDSYYSGYAPVPAIETAGGYCKAGTTVSISVPENTVVRYTLDGSIPNETSAVYDAPITISSSVTLKAAAFADGLLRSDAVFSTFLVEEPHSVPVLCISADKDGLFGEAAGIYNLDSTLYSTHGDLLNQKWEEPADYEYYVDGKPAVSFSAGIRLFGSGSRYFNQRGLAVMLRDCYGRNTVSYPFFGKNGHLTSSALVLRAGGQDQIYTILRDSFCERVALRSGAKLVAAETQPVAVYINGRYWGLYELREKLNEDFFEMNYGIDKSSLDIILNNGIVSAGSFTAFRELNEQLSALTHNTEEEWQFITENIDIESAADHLIYESFFKNIDYGNIRLYKDTNDGKWRWILFDMDMSMREGSVHASVTTIGKIFEQDSVKSKLLKNDRFRDFFLERYAEQLDTVFTTENLLSILDEMADEFEPEIERNYERWGVLPYNKWISEMDMLRERLGMRRELLLRELSGYFDLSDEDMIRIFGEAPQQ